MRTVKNNTPKPDWSYIGIAMRRARVSLNITIEDMAQRAGVSVGYLSRVEKGHQNPSLKLIFYCADAAECSVSVMITPKSSIRKRQ